MVTTNSVMQLHQRLKNSDETPTASGERKQEMIKELENAVMMTQSMLTKITTPTRFVIIIIVIEIFKRKILTFM